MRSAIALIGLLAVAAVPVALAKPPGAPPEVKGVAVTPPPAWVSAPGISRWMKFSSYCWRTDGKAACVDMIPPQSRTDLPLVRVRSGTLVQFHVRFLPRTLHVTVYHRLTFEHYGLPLRRDVTWKARRSGVLELEARGSRGSAAYLIRLRVV